MLILLRRCAMAAALLGLMAASPAPDAASLPLVVQAPKSAGDTLAIFYSGDGGWAAADEGVAEALSRRGVGVVGVNSLRYFAGGRGPDEAAEDLAAIINKYGGLWGRSKVIVAGYSFGAGAAPMIAERLAPALRGRVRLVALLAPLRWGSLRFYPTSWLDIPPPGARPIAPTLAALKPTTVVCIYGAADRAAACPGFGPALVREAPLDGGHHLGGDYGRVVDLMLAALG